jgi:hypothetical protein
MEASFTMNVPVMKTLRRLGWRGSICVIAATLLTTAVVAGWASSSILATSTAAVSDAELTDATSGRASATDDLKPRLIGSYRVTGTDPDGTPYVAAAMVDIALAPSGALELSWDNGKQAGVGQVIGNVLAVACLSKGRTVILTMTINPDGSLTGHWSRRTDRGNKGTETWRKT